MLGLFAGIGVVREIERDLLGFIYHFVRSVVVDVVHGETCVIGRDLEPGGEADALGGHWRLRIVAVLGVSGPVSQERLLQC